MKLLMVRSEPGMRYRGTEGIRQPIGAGAQRRLKGSRDVAREHWFPCVLDDLAVDTSRVQNLGL